MPEENQPLFEWEAPEFKHYEKSLSWYLLLGAAVLGLAVYQILTADYFGATTMVILGILIALFAQKKPNTVYIALDNQGITLDEMKIPYKSFQEFWIVETAEHRTLNLQASTYIKQTIIVELLEQDTAKIRKLLAKHLPEAEHNLPTFSQRIAHHLRF